MTDCDPNEAKAYYNSLYKDSIDCFDPDIEIKMSFAETAVPFIEDVSDDNIEKLSYEEYAQKTPIDQIRVSLLMAKGDVGYVFKKYENDIYVLEFEPFKTSQENEA